MLPFRKATASRTLMMGLSLAAFVTLPARGLAGPGDHAANQNRYQAIKTGAVQLQRGFEALERADDKFKGHRRAAMDLIQEALTELDRAVRYADNNPKAGERGKSIFEPERGKIASTQGKFPSIRRGANHVIDAGKALDVGFDRFGGHRVDALRALNRALDQLEKAVKTAD
jgi:hypothetical protein